MAERARMSVSRLTDSYDTGRERHCMSSRWKVWRCASMLLVQMIRPGATGELASRLRAGRS